MNDSIPEEIYNIIGIKNMNTDLLYTIKNNNIKKFITQAFTKNSEHGIPLLCNNPNTVDIIYQYIEKDEKKLDNIPIGYLLINETNNEKYQEYIFNIFLKKYEYEKKRKNVNYIYNQISLNLTKIFNPKVLSYILDNNFLFIDTKVVLLYIQKGYDKKNLELKKIAKNLTTNFKYNPDGLKYIKKYNL